MTKFLNDFSQFLLRSRVVLIAVVAAVALFFVGYFVWTGMNNRANERSTLLAEQSQQSFDEWMGMEDGDKKTEAENALQESLTRIIREYPHRYAAQRALFIRGRLLAEKKDWKGAAESFQDLARSFPDSYLAEIGLFNAGAAHEESGQTDPALDAYKRLAETYPKSFLAPRSVFATGRLYEAKEDFTQAAAAYNRLADEYPASSWTKAGRNRIIELQAQGKIAASK